MQYRPPTNELYLEIMRSGNEELIALARSYADAEFTKDRSSWARAVDRGMATMISDGHATHHEDEKK